MLAFNSISRLALKELHDDNIEEFEKQIDTINSEIDKLIEECEKLGIPFGLINSSGHTSAKRWRRKD